MQLNMKTDNVGKCGHAKCAGGAGELCYEKGKPMKPYAPMKEYRIEITETLQSIETVTAESEEEAMELVREAYRDQTIILSADNANVEVSFTSVTE